MREKSEILLRLLGHGWTVHTFWKKETIYLVFYIDVFTEFRNERRYSVQYKEELNNFLLVKSKEDYLNYMELKLLNQLYDKILTEQLTKVL